MQNYNLIVMVMETIANLTLKVKSFMVHSTFSILVLEKQRGRVDYLKIRITTFALLR